MLRERTVILLNFCINASPCVPSATLVSLRLCKCQIRLRTHAFGVRYNGIHETMGIRGVFGTRFMRGCFDVPRRNGPCGLRVR